MHHARHQLKPWAAPWLFLRPKLANHSGPRRRMVGATATVSTLVTVDGQPYRPTLAGNGGFSRGFPCLPSRLSMSAVSSPAPRRSGYGITHGREGLLPLLALQALNEHGLLACAAPHWLQPYGFALGWPAHRTVSCNAGRARKLLQRETCFSGRRDPEQ